MEVDALMRVPSDQPAVELVAHGEAAEPTLVRVVLGEAPPRFGVAAELSCDAEQRRGRQGAERNGRCARFDNGRGSHLEAPRETWRVTGGTPDLTSPRPKD